MKRITKLHKKAVRILSSYSSHTEPLFRCISLLKANDILKLAKLKFYHSYINKKLSVYLLKLPFKTNNTIHNHNTIQAQQLHSLRVIHTIVKQSLVYNIPSLINTLPSIIYKLMTHSLVGLSQFCTKLFIQIYLFTCNIYSTLRTLA